MTRHWKFVFALAFAIGASMAAQAITRYIDLEQRLTREQLHDTGLDTLSPEQLARLNALLRDEAAAAPPPAPVAAAPRSESEPPRSLLGLDSAPIKGRLKGTISGWEPGIVFEFEDGQQWKVLKGSMKLHKPMVAPDAVVVPGIGGRWFLQVDEDLPKARVYRID